MNILVIDTETVSINKPYCYDIGFLVYDTEQDRIIEKGSYIVEQIWHNRPLFSTAYYESKRQKYIGQLRGRQAALKKYGYIMQNIGYIIKKYNIQSVYAYNCTFDKRVFDFNSGYYNCKNPLDSLQWYDIQGYTNIIPSEEYAEFCISNNLYTDSLKYFSTTAEVMYKFISDNTEFIEDHTGLQDCLIELEILKYCINLGLSYECNIQSKLRFSDKATILKLDGKEILLKSCVRKKNIVHCKTLK